MERRVSTRFEKYWTESGRGDGQGDVEKKDHQSYRCHGPGVGPSLVPEVVAYFRPGYAAVQK